MTFSALTLVAMSINLHTQGYDGPGDDIIWKLKKNVQPGKFDNADYYDALYWTTLGPLARYSDIIGVGQVSQLTNGHFVVTVDHALVGCTNGAAILMYGEWMGLKIFEELFEGEDPRTSQLFPLIFYFPTNESRIVFAVTTNDYSWAGSPSRMYWNHAEIPEEPGTIHEENRLRYLNRSWWYADRDDGVLLAQFTNVVQAVRIDRNWTNYFYLVRDGVNSTSNRVREDSHRDLWDFCFDDTTVEQKQFILADPLIDQNLKDRLNEWLLNNPPPTPGSEP